MPDMKQVASSNIAEIGYVELYRELYVRFANGWLYRFYDVEPRVHRELMAAESKGRYFNAAIKDHYGYTRLDRRGGPDAGAVPPGLHHAAA